MTKIEPKLEVEASLNALVKSTNAKDKSFVPVEHRGIHEMIEEVQELAELVLHRLRDIRQRLDEFDDLQSRFYKGPHK